MEHEFAERDQFNDEQRERVRLDQLFVEQRDYIWRMVSKRFGDQSNATMSERTAAFYQVLVRLSEILDTEKGDFEETFGESRQSKMDGMLTRHLDAIIAEVVPVSVSVPEGLLSYEEWNKQFGDLLSGSMPKERAEKYKTYRQKVSVKK